MGSTCLEAAHEDNPEDFPSCVQRGLDDDPCANDDDCDFDHYWDDDGRCREKGDIDDDCSFNDPDDPQPDDEEIPCKAGLKCHPEDSVCTANCVTDYPCTSDFECMSGESCVPITVGDDADTWHACAPIGDSAADRCDDNADCEDDRRCNGGICDVDANNADACASDSDCAEGLFCDLAAFSETGSSRTASQTCTPYFSAGTSCFPVSISLGFNSGCNPDTAPACVYVDDNSQWECTTSKREEDALCYNYESIGYPGEPTDCETGLICDYWDSTASFWTCTPGAAAGDDCDTSVSDPTLPSCGLGLFCDPTDGVCVEQVGPGGDCEDPNTSAAESGLCANGDCVEHWDGNGSFICTDAPIPVDNEGDGLTCNG
jgi:hypothetical protein